MKAGRHDLDSEGHVTPQRQGRLAVAELAFAVAPGREEDLEPRQASVHITR